MLQIAAHILGRIRAQDGDQESLRLSEVFDRIDQEILDAETDVEGHQSTIDEAKKELEAAENELRKAQERLDQLKPKLQDAFKIWRRYVDDLPDGTMVYEVSPVSEWGTDNFG